MERVESVIFDRWLEDLPILTDLPSKVTDRVSIIFKFPTFRTEKSIEIFHTSIFHTSIRTYRLCYLQFTNLIKIVTKYKVTDCKNSGSHVQFQ